MITAEIRCLQGFHPKGGKSDFETGEKRREPGIVMLLSTG
jgi:hypothetical protein